uniref:SFRICE_030477 n=1 Tax=Spodoptera frugiperda TaxID=7108 RepID=A0A2H1WSS1_SPOFR
MKHIEPPRPRGPPRVSRGVLAGGTYVLHNNALVIDTNAANPTDCCLIGDVERARMLLDHAVSSEAGLLDPIRSMFNPIPSSRPRRRPDLLLGPLVSRFRDSELRYDSMDFDKNARSIPEKYPDYPRPYDDTIKTHIIYGHSFRKKTTKKPKGKATCSKDSDEPCKEEPPKDPCKEAPPKDPCKDQNECKPPKEPCNDSPPKEPCNEPPPKDPCKECKPPKEPCNEPPPKDPCKDQKECKPPKDPCKECKPPKEPCNEPPPKDPCKDQKECKPPKEPCNEPPPKDPCKDQKECKPPKEPCKDSPPKKPCKDEHNPCVHSEPQKDPFKEQEEHSPCPQPEPPKEPCKPCKPPPKEPCKPEPPKEPCKPPPKEPNRVNHVQNQNHQKNLVSPLQRIPVVHVHHQNHQKNLVSHLQRNQPPCPKPEPPCPKPEPPCPKPEPCNDSPPKEPCKDKPPPCPPKKEPCKEEEEKPLKDENNSKWQSDDIHPNDPQKLSYRPYYSKVSASTTTTSKVSIIGTGDSKIHPFTYPKLSAEDLFHAKIANDLFNSKIPFEPLIPDIHSDSLDNLPNEDSNNAVGRSYDEWPEVSEAEAVVSGETPSNFNAESDVVDETTTKSNAEPDDSEYDDIIAQRFPQAIKLLEELKKLNQLKAILKLQKLQKEGHVSAITENSEYNEPTEAVTKVSSKKSYNFRDISDLLVTEKFLRTSTEASYIPKKVVLTKLLKKRHNYQAKFV